MPEPKISCLIATHGRPHYLNLALEFFQKQTWPNKEALVLIDSDDLPIKSTIRKDLLKDVNVIRLPGRRPPGEKRNFGVMRAQGKYLAIWDDDDWYAPNRLADEIQPILQNKTDFAAFQTDIVFVLPEKRWLKLEPGATRVIGNGLNDTSTVCTVESWNKAGGNSSSMIGEIHDMLRRARKMKMRVDPVKNKNHFVYVRHPSTMMGPRFLTDHCLMAKRPYTFSRSLEDRYLEACRRDG